MKRYTIVMVEKETGELTVTTQSYSKLKSAEIVVNMLNSNEALHYWKIFDKDTMKLK